MQRLNRRQAMIRMGLGTAGMLWLPGGARATPMPDHRDLTELAERFRTTPREQVFEPAAAALRAGADVGTLLGAAFLAGIHDVRPRSVGGKLHCVMMVESAFQLIAGAPAREARLAALWSIDDFKKSQDRDRAEGDWVLPPRPDVTFASAAEGRRELTAAMETWDAERADRAIVGLLPFHERTAAGRESLFELLWPYAGRCYVDIGHKIIFAAQLERVLVRLGGRTAEPALRSLVNGLLYVDDSISPSETAVFERSCKLAPALPEDWLGGREDPGQSAVLLEQMRACDPAGAQDLVVEAFADGLGPATVWDGLRLYASELFHRRPKSAARRHGPVHGVTEVNAFAYVARRSADDTTRRLMILQAAAWLPLLRRDLGGFFGPLEGPGLDVLGAGSDGTPDLQAIFEEPAPGAARALLDRDPQAAAAFLAELRSHLVERAFQSHQYKYAAAIGEESALAHPRWASRILAPAVTYLPTPNDPDTEVTERAVAALRRAGVA